MTRNEQIAGWRAAIGSWQLPLMILAITIAAARPFASGAAVEVSQPPPPAAAAVDVDRDIRSHWAFRPVVRPSIPKSGARPSESVSGTEPVNPVDAFIGAKLAEKNLWFSPEADRITLIRRLY